MKAAPTAYVIHQDHIERAGVFHYVAYQLLHTGTIAEAQGRFSQGQRRPGSASGGAPARSCGSPQAERLWISPACRWTCVRRQLLANSSSRRLTEARSTCRRLLHAVGLRNLDRTRFASAAMAASSSPLVVRACKSGGSCSPSQAGSDRNRLESIRMNCLTWPLRLTCASNDAPDCGRCILELAI